MSELDQENQQMDTEPQYVVAADTEDSDEPMELPCEHDGTLLLSTVQGSFPGALGLKYRSPSGNAWRGIRLADGILHPPAGGWSNTTYIITMPKTDSVKRKMEDDSSREPEAKLVKTISNEYTGQQDLIVLGLSFHATENDMKSYFEQFGEVTLAEVKKDMVTGKSRGFGFIRFADAMVAKTVLNKTHTISGRKCEVKRPKSKETPNKLFVGRLPPDTNEGDLKDFFEQYGETSDVYIPKPYRGFSFITFCDPEDAHTIMSLQTPLKFKDHQLNITFAEPKSDGKDGRGMDRGMRGGRGGGDFRGGMSRGGRGGFHPGGARGGDVHKYPPTNHQQQDGPFDFEDMMKMFNSAEKMQAFASFMSQSAADKSRGSSSYSPRGASSTSTDPYSRMQQQQDFRGTDYSNYSGYYQQ